MSPASHVVHVSLGLVHSAFVVHSFRDEGSGQPKLGRLRLSTPVRSGGGLVEEAVTSARVAIDVATRKRRIALSESF
jgi:hypothetical protein